MLFFLQYTQAVYYNSDFGRQNILNNRKIRPSVKFLIHVLLLKGKYMLKSSSDFDEWQVPFNNSVEDLRFIEILANGKKVTFFSLEKICLPVKQDFIR